MKRANAPHNEAWEVWEPARGYVLQPRNRFRRRAPLGTLIRKHPKAANGKAAVKAAKRARQRNRQSAITIAA